MNNSNGSVINNKNNASNNNSIRHPESGNRYICRQQHINSPGTLENFTFI